MASTSQLLVNSATGRLVVKIEGTGADTTTLDASVAGVNMPEDGTAQLVSMWWTMASGDITITWKGGDKVAAILSGNGSWTASSGMPAIANNATSPTGDVTIIKGTASAYTCILEFANYTTS